MAVHRSDTAYRAMPPWTEVEATLDVVCKLCERLDDVFPVAELDVVVVGIFHQVSACRVLLYRCLPTAGSWRCQQNSPRAWLGTKRSCKERALSGPGSSWMELSGVAMHISSHACVG